MVASQEEKQQVEAVIQEWKSTCEVTDMESVKALWDQDYHQLIFIAEDANDPLTDWASISAFYDTVPPMVKRRMNWKMDNLMVDIIDAAAYAYCTLLINADLKSFEHSMVFNARFTFMLRKTGGRWKIIHFHESLSRDRSQEVWGFLWS